MNYVTNVGEVLLNLCSIAKMNNVNIQIFRDSRYAVDRTVFELRLNRDTFYASELIEIDQRLKCPAEALECAFNKALYNIKREIEKERTNHD